jgi:uncharacterized protein YxeA
METILLIIIIILLITAIGLQFAFRTRQMEDQSQKMLETIEKSISRVETAVKEEVKSNR